jgi:hypothetical protein
MFGAGCATQQERRAMTVEAAMQQVAGGLNAFAAMPLDKRTGLVPDEVTVVFNVSRMSDSAAGVNGGVSVDPGKLVVDFSRRDSETQGNQITLKFSNLLLAGKTSIAGSLTPAQIEELIRGLTNAGFVVKSPPPPTHRE